ncbi:DUF4439 domain-containing protein [Demequina gelatinilytica]|uniref:DUF4439 domain-containing protein n=1 Tax=Demequina gelatinilytica TaxID=1638980 RepID=UPI0012E0B010|nr:DUF4439 domain-containing protein [Demequina gelatinilytica]
MTPPPRRTMRLIAAVAGLATLAGGCSWRMETPPIPSRTPTPTVVLRDAAAVREQAVIATADSTEAGLLEAELAPERLEALGGVYVEYPSASPAPSPSVEAATFAAAVTEAIDGALADAADAASEDPGLAAMLRSIALSHAMATTYASLAGAEPAERTMPGSGGTGLLPRDGTAVDGDLLARLALAHDQAAFAYEVAAARAEEDERADALKRSRIHAARADALVALPGVEDLREPLYDVAPVDTASATGRAAMEVALELALSEDYAALIDGADDADVAWILDAAYDAFAAAAALPGFDASSVPVLPGLTTS